MLKRYILYRCIIAVLILCGSSYTVSTAHAYEQNAQSDSWSYRQAYGSGVSSSPIRSSSAGYQISSGVPAVTGSSYKGNSVYGNAFNTTFSEDVRPDYSFRSTSSYAPASSAPVYSAPQNGPRRERSTFSWDEPDDNPIGTVTNPTPVGEPLILLLLAVLYAVILRLRARVGVKKQQMVQS